MLVCGLTLPLFPGIWEVLRAPSMRGQRPWWSNLQKLRIIKQKPTCSILSTVSLWMWSLRYCRLFTVALFNKSQQSKCMSFFSNSQVAFGVELDLLKKTSPFPLAIEKCLMGMVYHLRDTFFQVTRHCLTRVLWQQYWKLCEILKSWPNRTDFYFYLFLRFLLYNVDP